MMEVLKKITPDMVLQAYETTGYLPLAKDWFEESNDEESKVNACALTAVIVEHYHVEPVQVRRIMRAFIYGVESADEIEDQDECLFSIFDELDQDYILGFIEGFDQCRSMILSIERMLEGFEDGQRCHMAVLDKYGKIFGL